MSETKPLINDLLFPAIVLIIGYYLTFDKSMTFESMQTTAEPWKIPIVAVLLYVIIVISTLVKSEK